MAWVEQIRMRSSEIALREVLPLVDAQVQGIRRGQLPVQAFCLQHSLYDGDLAVVMIWFGEGLPEKSREGLLIADTLRQLGSVDHAVWIPAAEQDGYSSVC